MGSCNNFSNKLLTIIKRKTKKKKADISTPYDIFATFYTEIKYHQTVKFKVLKYH